MCIRVFKDIRCIVVTEILSTPYTTLKHIIDRADDIPHLAAQAQHTLECVHETSYMAATKNEKPLYSI